MNAKEVFFEKMQPYAARASSELGIPSSVILAQWAHESAYGTSWGATHRLNFGGISNGTGTIYSWSKAASLEPRPANEGAWYYVYKSIDDFVDDYIHVMNLSYYGDVRRAGATPGVEDDVLALAKSPYAGDHYGGTGQSLINIIKNFKLLNFDKNNSDAAELGLAIKNSNETLINEDMKMVIVTGAAALMFIAFLDRV